MFLLDFFNKEPKLEGFNLEDINLLQTISVDSISQKKDIKPEVESKENLNVNTQKMEKQMDETKFTEILTNFASKFQPKNDKDMVEKAQLDSVNVELNSAKAELETVKSDLETAKVANDEEIAKLNSKIETLESEKKALSDQIEVINMEKANAQEEATKAKYLNLAKDYSGLVGTEEEIANKIREIDESAISDETKEELKTALKATSEKNKKLTDENGSDGEDPDAELSDEAKAEKEIYAKAEKMSSEQNITIEDAVYKIRRNV